MRKRIPFFVLPCMLVFSVLLTGCAGGQNTQQTEHTTGSFAMGTYMTLTAYGENGETEISEQTGGALDPTIYPLVDMWGFINGEHHIPTGQELTELLQYTGYEKVILQENTVALPEGVQLDLGAVGKGYVGQELSILMKNHGITYALLDIGGNIQMVGRRPDGAKWRLGIKNPFGVGSFGILEAEDCAVVTSGAQIKCGIS